MRTTTYLLRSLVLIVLFVLVVLVVLVVFLVFIFLLVLLALLVLLVLLVFSNVLLYINFFRDFQRTSNNRRLKNGWPPPRTLWWATNPAKTRTTKPRGSTKFCKGKHSNLGSTKQNGYILSFAKFIALSPNVLVYHQMYW